MTEYDDAEHDELGRLVRASLDAQAGEGDTSVPVAARARGAARKRRGRWVAAGAAVTVAAVAVTAVVVDRAGPPSSGEPPVASPSLSATPDGWRTEYWHDISVQVPADWGWGTAPMTVGGFPDEGASLCGGPGAIRTAEGKDLVNPDPTAAYVGRPIMLSDVCGPGTVARPEAPYVWFDAQVEPGTVDLAGGYVQDTVEVDADGTTVTVGSDDQALRERMLASVGRQDLCPASVGSGGPDVGGLPTEGVGDLRTFDLCAYTRSVGHTYRLVYGADLDSRTYARWQQALPDPDDALATGCPMHDEMVVLTGTFDDPYGTAPVALTWVVDVACNLVDSAADQAVSTPEMKDIWASRGIPEVLPTFIGPMG